MFSYMWHSFKLRTFFNIYIAIKEDTKELPVDIITSCFQIPGWAEQRGRRVLIVIRPCVKYRVKKIKYRAPAFDRLPEGLCEFLQLMFPVGCSKGKYI